jgi:hypothetical protein
VFGLGSPSSTSDLSSYLTEELGSKDIYDIQNPGSHLANWQAVAQIAGSHGYKDLVTISLRGLGIANPL